MIALRRLNNEEFVLNSDLIETMEATPDTVLTLTTGKKIIVRNSLEDIVRKTIKYKQLCGQTIQVIDKQSDP
ncbi:MAG: flagellar FlbD family protein [Chitinispirillia bacterium]|nr:flagellar FlbD family protein [Chitinispirillia bacterium]